ncbi:MAG: hypothetical protein F6K17_31195 [Okeania sp. SIO3C4]|nr:hypothetical protein [Okeania sp. SIO3B3]NER06728.1 hypothetical protein [Okeania sp. SIO3C4]
MSKKSAKDIRLWSLSLLIILISVYGFLSWYFSSDNNAKNYYADKTGVTWIILGLFFVALMINAINTLSILVQFRDIKNLEGLNAESLLKNAEGLFREHIQNLQQASENKLSLEQDFSLNLIENKLLRKESWVGLFSNLMITLGMIGTILGLTTAISGLSEAMSSLGENFDNSNSPLIGLNDALSGMSSAFVTTLDGAILGGFFLKIISHSTTNLIEDLIDNIRQKTELEVIPYLQNQIWSRETNNLSQAHQNLRHFINTVC